MVMCSTDMFVVVRKGIELSLSMAACAAMTTQPSSAIRNSCWHMFRFVVHDGTNVWNRAKHEAESMKKCRGVVQNLLTSSVDSSSGQSVADVSPHVEHV